MGARKAPRSEQFSLRLRFCRGNGGQSGIQQVGRNVSPHQNRDFQELSRREIRHPSVNGYGRSFLRDATHWITVRFTPKHASWINRIEIWFPILVRKLLLVAISPLSSISSRGFPVFVSIAVLLAIALNMAMAAQDKYTVSVPGGLAFSEFRGYENWQSVSVSKTGHAFAIVLANPVMIEAYRSGIPGNGKPFPEGSKIAKMHYSPVKSADAPDPNTEVPGTLLNVDFIVKDSKRFTDNDSGGWGYAAFNYNAASDTFAPANENDTPPQSNDAKCGVACHTIAQAKDHMFTAYQKR